MQKFKLTCNAIPKKSISISKLTLAVAISFGAPPIKSNLKCPIFPVVKKRNKPQINRSKLEESNVTAIGGSY